LEFRSTPLIRVTGFAPIEKADGTRTVKGDAKPPAQEASHHTLQTDLSARARVLGAWKPAPRYDDHKEFQALTQEQLNDSSETPGWEKDLLARMNDEFILQKDDSGPPAFDWALGLHGTDPANRPSIGASGLIPGLVQGIGDPVTGKPDTDYVYAVAQLNEYKGETGHCLVWILHKEKNGPTVDTNFPFAKGKPVAIKFHGKIPPLRSATTDATPNAYCFFWPMSPRTVRGAASALGRQGKALREEEAREMIEALGRKSFSIHFCRPEDYQSSAENSPATPKKGIATPGDETSTNNRKELGVFELDL
jgi:hypothetical protein